MIAIASDHGGYELKTAVIAHLKQRGLPYKDCGCCGTQSCDYPDYGRAAAEAVAGGECDRGIVICTTGIGISIAANRLPAIRCGLCTDPYMAKMTRAHNDANMLALGAAVVGTGLALEIVDVFLDTPFSGEEKHVRRIGKLNAGSSVDKYNS
jgi:ribose 5-phosphate isomerase B